MSIFCIDSITRETVNRIIKDEWDGPIIVSKGKIIDTSENKGFVFAVGGVINGFVTYVISNNECEITTLKSIDECIGVATQLIQSVIYAVKAAGCRRVWLITTNDNTHAIRFYQKIGFSLKAVHINAIEISRELKPSIPLYGIDRIPILHEFEFEMFV